MGKKEAIREGAAWWQEDTLWARVTVPGTRVAPRVLAPLPPLGPVFLLAGRSPSQSHEFHENRNHHVLISPSHPEHKAA